MAQIEKSTKMQMISDVPLGAFLSGGVDSSLIAATMGHVKTFSIGFDDPTYNELAWARKVAAHIGVSHKDEIIRPDVIALFDKLMHFMDDPIGDFSIFPTYLVSKLARKHVTVALSGDGGDELFAGYESYLAQEKARLFQRLPGWLRNGIITPFFENLRPGAQKKGLLNKAKRFVEGCRLSGSNGTYAVENFCQRSSTAGIIHTGCTGHRKTPASDHVTALFKAAETGAHLTKALCRRQELPLRQYSYQGRQNVNGGKP